MNFSKKYPHIHWWIENQGYLQLGGDEFNKSFVTVIDEGGVCFEAKNAKTIEEGLESAEAFLIKDIPDRFGEDAMK